MKKGPVRKKASLGSKKKKNKGGRPKEKVKDKVDFRQLEVLCRKGFGDRELAEFFEVAERTIRRWKKDKGFQAAVEAGKELEDANVVRSLYERACGYSCPEIKIASHEGKITDSEEFTKHYPPDTNAIKTWLTNRKPEEWRDRQEVKVTRPLEIKPLTKKEYAKLEKRDVIDRLSKLLQS